MYRPAHGRRALRAEVRQELRSLGASKDDVARRLEAAGVRGRPGKVADCALAVYLSAVVGSDPRVRTVRVLPSRVVIAPNTPWRRPLTVALPKALRRFVTDFDRHDYPLLVRHLTAGDRATEPVVALAPNWLPVIY